MCLLCGVVRARRGLARGDGAIINMRIAPAAAPGSPYPGLDKERFFFDTDQDLLDLSQVSVRGCFLFEQLLFLKRVIE